MLTKNDVLPSLVVIVGVISMGNPNGMLAHWRESINTSVSPHQVQAGEFAITMPPNWKFKDNTLSLGDGTVCEVRQSPKTSQTMNKLLELLKQKYPTLKVVENATHQVLVLNHEKTIIVFEGSNQYLLVTVPLSHVSELLKGLSLGAAAIDLPGTPQPVAL